MRSGLKTSLLLILILSTGCETTEVVQSGACAEFKPILFSIETKNWLMERSPWPTSVKNDLNKVGDHNEVWCALCKKEKKCR